MSRSLGCSKPIRQGTGYFTARTCLKEFLILSAILDALRKIERETAQRTQQPSSLPNTRLAEILFKKRRRKAFRRRVVFIAFLVLAGAGVLITLDYKPFFSKDKASPPKVTEVPRKDKEIKTSTVPIRKREEAPKPASVVKEPAPEPVKLAKKEEPITLPSLDEIVHTVTDKALQKPAPRISAQPSPPIEPRRSETIIRDLELQAIVWSEDPGSCSAMINGRLVRLGGEVGGFTVNEIGRNYVYLKSGFRTGKLRMIGSR